jgi:hypothetical protein
MKKVLLACCVFAIIANVALANTEVFKTTIEKNISFTDKIKVKLQNKGDDKIEIFYQETIGSKNLSGATINGGSMITINVEAGSQVYYKVKGSKGALILTISADMNGTTQIVKQ